jgi:hypothetical protein
MAHKMVRQTLEEAVRATMKEAEEIKALHEKAEVAKSYELAKSGKWTSVLNGKVLVKGIVELRYNGDGKYDIYIAGYKVVVE